MVYNGLRTQRSSLQGFWQHSVGMGRQRHFFPAMLSIAAEVVVLRTLHDRVVLGKISLVANSFGRIGVHQCIKPHAAIGQGMSCSPQCSKLLVIPSLLFPIHTAKRMHHHPQGHRGYCQIYTYDFRFQQGIRTCTRTSRCWIMLLTGSSWRLPGTDLRNSSRISKTSKAIHSVRIIRPLIVGITW